MTIGCFTCKILHNKHHYQATGGDFAKFGREVADAPAFNEYRIFYL